MSIILMPATISKKRWTTWRTQIHMLDDQRSEVAVRREDLNAPGR